MPLPPSTDFTGSSVTEGSFKTAMTAMRDWLALLNGTVDDYIRVARGSNATRPAATEGGWLRWNTDNLVIDVAMATGLWHKIATSVIDATWALRFDFNQAALVLFKSTHAGDIATARVENNSGDYTEIERTATHTIVRSSGTDPVAIEIDGTRVFSIDSAGNLKTLGNILANDPSV